MALTMTSPNALIPAEVTEIGAVGVHRLAQLQTEADELARGAKAKNTRKAYERAWLRFIHWCEGLDSELRTQGETPGKLSYLPATPLLVQSYITDAAERGIPSRQGSRPPQPLSRSSIEVHLAAITAYHHAAKLPDPVAALPHDFLQGLRRRLAKAPRKKLALTQGQLGAIVAAHPRDTLRGLRDRAILLTAYYSGGRRRSEVAGLQVEDMVRHPEGWLWTLTVSKTNQAGEKPDQFLLAVDSETPEVCPATALDDWLRAAGISSGSVFRPIGQRGEIRAARSVDARLVASLVKKGVQRLGLPAEAYAGHSLRSGMITELFLADVPLPTIMRMAGHRQAQTTLGYGQTVDLLRDKDGARAALARRRKTGTP